MQNSMKRVALTSKNPEMAEITLVTIRPSFDI
jgi:hypothetical protein